MAQYWLVKSEPNAYSWETFIKEGKTHWDGVRNHQAKKNMVNMKKGDLVFFYHSVSEKTIKGIAKVTTEAYPDHTAGAPGEHPWMMVDIEPVRAFKAPVTLADIKADPRLQEVALVRQSRLSVLPLTKSDWDAILDLEEANK